MINNFEDFLTSQKSLDYYIRLESFINSEYKKYKVYPNFEDIFNAFYLTSYNDTKVVIIGQDPYHEENQAYGLSFATKSKILPPSLKNIFKEMSNDLGEEIEAIGDLSYLSKQGVLLLNSILTVREHDALSHKGKGWEVFTDNYIRLLEQNNNVIVYVLLGNYAKNKESLITNSNHYIVKASHPSPLSASSGFFSSKIFSKVNNILKNNNVLPIIWNYKKYKENTNG